MIAFPDAKRLVSANLSPLPVEWTPLLAAQGRIVSSAVRASMPLPPFDHAAMDGFALRAADAEPGRPLPVKLSAMAGPDIASPLPQGAACRIMTGAALPPGADAVLPFEQAEQRDGHVVPLRAVEAGEHVRRAGEDVAAGTTVLEPGQILTPSRIALLAALGKTHLMVHAPARVAILTTGDERVEPGTPLGPGQLYDANAYALMAMVAEAGGMATRLSVAADDLQTTRRLLSRALAFDMVITSGGVSRPDRDHVAEAIAELGTVHFHRVAQQPGMPMLFATAQGKPIFALPGNPASTMVTFELFVRPALRRMLGHVSQERPRVMARMTDAWQKEPGKLAVLRARVTKEEPGGYHARLTGPQGPMSFTTTASANALVLVPAGSEGFRPGDRLETMLLEPAEVCGMACLPIGGDAGIATRCP